jgi:hypothetical protein
MRKLKGAIMHFTYAALMYLAAVLVKNQSAWSGIVFMVMGAFATKHMEK